MGGVLEGTGHDGGGLAPHGVDGGGVDGVGQHQLADLAGVGDVAGVGHRVDAVEVAEALEQLLTELVPAPLVVAKVRAEALEALEQALGVVGGAGHARWRVWAAAGGREAGLFVSACGVAQWLAGGGFGGAPLKAPDSPKLIASAWCPR